mgnify:CR=1 FL=1
MAMRWREELPSFAGAAAWINGRADREALFGKPVLVHFWAVSCHLCKEELPIVNHWREAYGERCRLQLVGVHMPRLEQDKDPGLVREAALRHELTHPVIIDNELKVSVAFRNACVPAYYLFDGKLRLRHFQAAGGSGLRWFDLRLRKILGEIAEK